MKSFIVKQMGIILVSFTLILAGVQVGSALDNLSLGGIVRSVDKDNGIITLNVTSESCRGLRTFRVPDDAKDDLDDSLIGKRLLFSIDSAKCEKGKIYNIIFKE